MPGMMDVLFYCFFMVVLVDGNAYLSTCLSIYSVWKEIRSRILQRGRKKEILSHTFDTAAEGHIVVPFWGFYSLMHIGSDWLIA